ncbi:hypothetical protein [Roseiconus lacunae]|uniref:hypothetical protein n=1 Tax=Roseiconus lacunae TaxID=2605694 RepID=UPI001E5A0670|nr:hypothetical protein [Roseiconus lacunae]MCD0458224.1 hypothetical protein [Roseiconus lacunae]
MLWTDRDVVKRLFRRRVLPLPILAAEESPCRHPLLGEDEGAKLGTHAMVAIRLPDVLAEVYQ